MPLSSYEEEVSKENPIKRELKGKRTPTTLPFSDTVSKENPIKRELKAKLGYKCQIDELQRFKGKSH